MNAAGGFLSIIDGLDDAEAARLIAALAMDEGRGAEHDWPSWAHAGQADPPGGWSTWVIKGGRGFGKTLAGTQWVRGAIEAGGAELRIALVGATLDDARRVMVEGNSGLLTVAGDMVAMWCPTRRLLRFESGAEAVLFSGASPQALRGPEHHIAWCDELAKWEHPQATWDMLQLGLRLGDHPRALVTTTPRAGPVLRGIMEAAGTVVTGGATRANPHLAAGWKQRMEAMYAGTRLGRQELDGELLTDAAGALWRVALIERCRLPSPLPGERFTRTVIAIDPPTGDGTCGIIACARDAAGVAHILADHSVTARSPEGWAGAVAAAVQIHGAGLVVAEANQGGKMVQAVLRTADPNMRVKLVTAIQGKSHRAEPVAHLFEAGKVLLHGRFPELEAEMLGMIAAGGYEGPGGSPDRADAMVWGLTELMLGVERREPRVMRF